MSDDKVLAWSGLRGLRPEASLLLALSRLRLTEAQCEEVHQFLAEKGRDLDWGYFLDQTSRHGVLPLVSRHLTQLRLVHDADGRTLAPYRWIYAYAYEGNKRRNLAIGDEYSKVIRGLNRRGIEYAIRKGPVLTEGVYHDLGLRRMGDLDVLLRPEALPEFTDMASELGYEQGHLSRNAERVVPFDRRTQLTWKINLANSTLPFLKPAQRDDVETFVLDPCFALFQPRSGITADVGDFLTRAVRTVAFGTPAWMLEPVDQIIDMCVQAHVEATTLMYIEMGKDLTVLKFLDLVELLRKQDAGCLERLAAQVREYGCEDSVSYALHHAALLYPGEIDTNLLSEFVPRDPALLDTYGVLDGAPQRWDRDFADRLFGAPRWRSLTSRSTVPGPRAVV
ncbi:nucleotidyltransferase family protein [Longispora albida]|uniref:nucleotidyltransferase family protein n=1 Tax=Longispora albida TaxID=203523 RepID=UPI0003682E8F|nr:nucleotidyltransferase family protein [Longispora albida]